MNLSFSSPMAVPLVYCIMAESLKCRLLLSSKRFISRHTASTNVLASIRYSVILSDLVAGVNNLFPVIILHVRTQCES